MQGTKTGKWREWLDAGLSLLFPNICQICRSERATNQEGYVCVVCRKDINWVKAPICQRCGLPFEGAITTPFECSNCRDLDLHFVSARAAVITTPVIREVLHRYKYEKGLWFEPFLAELLVKSALQEVNSTDWDWIVPVPLHPVRKREREFNQAERLAHHLSRATKVPLNSRILRRIAPTRTQTALSREERIHNMANAFSTAAGTDLNGARIILVDDVLTTGATTNSCAKTLRRNNSGAVCVWTVARGL